MDKVRRFMELKDTIASLEQQLDELNRQRAALEEQIIEEWADTGCNAVEIDGRRAYLRIDTYAETPQGMDAVIELLRSSKYKDLVKQTVHKGTLSALVRELDQLPEEWKGVIERGQRASLRVTRS